MDLDTGAPALLDQGDLKSALPTGAAIPGMPPPVDRAGRTLVDGAVIPDVPIRAALQVGAARRVVVSSGPESSPPRPIGPRRRGDTTAARAGMLLLHHQIERDLHEVSRHIPTVLLPTGIEAWPAPWDFGHAQQLISTAARTAGRFPRWPSTRRSEAERLSLVVVLLLCAGLSEAAGRILPLLARRPGMSRPLLARSLPAARLVEASVLALCR
jgi:predicted acylesterase/phospholipase RssA